MGLPEMLHLFWLVTILTSSRSMRPLSPSTSWRSRGTSCWAFPRTPKATSRTGSNPRPGIWRWVSRSSYPAKTKREPSTMSLQHHCNRDFCGVYNCMLNFRHTANVPKLGVESSMHPLVSRRSNGVRFYSLNTLLQLSSQPVMFNSWAF